MNKIVIYSSKRGTTANYAKWIAEELNCEYVPINDFDFGSLSSYDIVIFGGWLRGSGIVGFDKLKPYLENLQSRLLLFITGISEYNPENYRQICEINFAGNMDMSDTELFFCPGRYEPAHVKGIDKFLMRIARRMLISGKTKEEAAAANKMAAAIENGVDKTDKKYIDPIIKAVYKIEGDHIQE